MNNNNVYKLDAHTLRIFLKVCELQSVSQAANYFELNQSTVSHSLDRLRQSLGFKLFEKVGRNIVPTDNAKALIPRAEEIVSAIERLTYTGKYDPKEDPRPITIAANLNSMMGMLPKIRDAFWKTHPDRHIRFLELGSREKMEGFLGSGKADFLISVATDRYPPTFMSEPLFSDVAVAFYDPSQREAPSSSNAYFSARHGVLDFGGKVRSTIDTEIRRQNAHRNVVCSASNASVLAQLMKGTDIIASMPSKLQHDVMKDFAWCNVPFVTGIEIQFDLVWHKRNADSSRQKWALDVIRSAKLGAGGPI